MGTVIKRAEFKWLEEYLRLAELQFPGITGKLKHITVRSPALGSVQRSEAMVTRHVRGVYTITILRHSLKVDDLCTKRKVKKTDLLLALAHELAHIYTDKQYETLDHTPDMYMVTADLHKTFMMQLKSTGYVSEEEEK